MERTRTYRPETRPVDKLDSITLNEWDSKELRIIKQAILKSSIEGGVIVKNIDVNTGETELDEEFLERWIKWVYRNGEQDKKMTESEIPF